MTSCCQGLIDDSILFSQLRFFCSTVEHAFVAIDPIAINPPKNEMRAVGMESNEEGEIPLIQEPPLKKTKLLLWLAGGESDGKNTHLITHTHTLWWEKCWPGDLVCQQGEFYVSTALKQHKMLFPLCLGRLYVDGHLGSWFMASWRGFVCGHLGGDGGATGCRVEQGCF